MTIAANTGQMIYNNPHWAVSGGERRGDALESTVIQKDQSSIGQQIRLDVFIRQALEELAKERFFTQMSGVYNLPKHSGKTIKKFKYLPLLDDRNKNTQGIGPDGEATSGKAGNLYGSSKDVATIQGKLPTLTEYGGRVNRVGFTRTVIEGTASRLGFFYEFTKESLDFDNDATLLQHMGKEALRGAYEIQEDMIAIELLKGAGVQLFGGTATSIATVTGENGDHRDSLVTYKDLQKLALTLKENRAPNQLKASTGSQIIDSKIIGAGYALYVGYPLENQLRNMLDNNKQPAFIPVEKYAAAGTRTLHGEIGTIGQFRIVVVPEMPEYNGAGAQDASNDQTKYRKTQMNSGAPYGHSDTQHYYDVFPMLAVASEAFTCLGFQADMGGKGNFKMITKLPGNETADRTDPYGQSGFTSIQWTHGMLIEHPEWIAVFHTLAEV